MNDTFEVVAIVTSADNAAIAAIRNIGIRRYDVICSTCPQRRVYSFCYTPRHTVADHKQFRDDVALAAAKHAAEDHTTPRVDSPGEES